MLLVGGSSRIPLVSQLVTAELGRPTALDIHPKHTVALGAAIASFHTAEARAGASVAPVAPIEMSPEEDGTDDQAEETILAATGSDGLRPRPSTGGIRP